MLKKLIAPVVIGGTVLTGLVAGGSAYAATTTSGTTAVTAPAPGTHKGEVHAWLKAHHKEIRKQAVILAAGTIGVTPQALVADLRSGQSIAQVAEANGKTAQQVVDALTAAAEARVAQAVTAGQISQSVADAIDAKIPARVDALVHRVF
jgi:hypothetical protein